MMSDSVSGIYQFSGLSSGLQFYCVAYKPGSTDLTGATVNTLVAA
jgi:hypothetical protein